jgi:hypothetical protein
MKSLVKSVQNKSLSVKQYQRVIRRLGTVDQTIPKVKQALAQLGIPKNSDYYIGFLDMTRQAYDSHNTAVFNAVLSSL